TILAGKNTKLSLPVRSGQSELDQTIQFLRPETAQVMDKEIRREENRTRDITHNTITDEWKLTEFTDEVEIELPMNGLIHGSINKNSYTIKPGDPLSANAQCQWELTVGRKDWETKLITHSEMTSDLTTFYLKNKMVALYNGEEIFTKTWNEEIPRHFQ